MYSYHMHVLSLSLYTYTNVSFFSFYVLDYIKKLLIDGKTMVRNGNGGCGVVMWLWDIRKYEFEMNAFIFLGKVWCRVKKELINATTDPTHDIN